MTRLLRTLVCIWLMILIGATSAQDPAHLIAFESRNDGNSEIYVMQFNGQERKNLTNHPSRDVDPAWSPDGRQIAFASDRSGNYDIWIMDADGSNLINVTNTEINELSPSWSPDGKHLLCYQVDGNPFDPYLNRDICLISLESGSVSLLTNELSRDSEASWSPDGEHFVYTGVYDVGGFSIDAYKMRIDDPHSLLRLTHSDTYVYLPQWVSAKEIYYMSFGGVYLLDLEASESNLVFDPPLDGFGFDVLVGQNVTHIAFSGRHEDERDNKYSLWHYNVQTETFSEIENTGPNDYDMAWQPAGNSVNAQDARDDG